jgi:hypothetical protein
LDHQRSAVRLIAAGLPLLVIALVFGAIGYSTTKPGMRPIPPLPASTPASTGVQGEVTAVSDTEISITTESDETLTYALSPDVRTEVLDAISLRALQLGGWINGGAIPHPDTVLALQSLILLPEAVTP